MQRYGDDIVPGLPHPEPPARRVAHFRGCGPGTRQRRSTRDPGDRDHRADAVRTRGSPPDAIGARCPKRGMKGYGSGMRVAHVTVSYQEGLGYEENHLPFFQAGLGAEVAVITTPLPLASWQGLDHFQAGTVPGVHEDRGVRIHRLKARFRARKGTQFLLGALRRTLTEIKPDILHIHNPIGSLTVQTLAAAKALGLPVVIDCHLWHFLTHPHGFLGRAYYGLFRNVLLPRYRSVIRRYIPLGPEPEEVLHDLLGIPHSLMTHSTLGADTRSFRYEESARLETRRALGIPSGARVILFVGRIDRGKEIDVLVEAWKTLPGKYDSYLLLVGPAMPGMAEDIARAAGPEAGNKFILTGLVPNAELPGYMSAADVAVWPGNTGITMNEAMACHTALVHADADAGRHLTLYGNGAAFERGNARSLAGVLDSILADPSRLADMRLRSRRLAEEVFDWKVVAARTLKIYEDALQGTDPAAAIWGPAIQTRGSETATVVSIEHGDHASSGTVLPDTNSWSGSDSTGMRPTIETPSRRGDGSSMTPSTRSSGRAARPSRSAPR